MSKKCIKCNKNIFDNAIFCPVCGAKQVVQEKKEPEKIENTEIKKVEKKEESFSKKIKETQKSEIKETKNIEKTIDVEKEKTPVSILKEEIKKEEIQEEVKIDAVEIEVVDESIIIDDPFASKINYKEEEEKALKEQNVQKASLILKEISPNEKIEQILFPLISPHVKGFRCIISGNDGTKKEPSINKIGQILKMLGKIDDEKVVYLPFGNMPETFDVRKFYVIGDLSTAIERLFNLEDLSDEANHLQQEYVVYMERLLKAPKSAYIILSAQVTQLKGFLSLDPRIPYIFSQRFEYPDLTNDEIYKIFYEALPEFHKLQLPETFEFEFKGYLERNRRFFPFNNNELALYLAQTSSKQAKFELPKEKYNAASLDESFSTIIGMRNVKDQVKELSLYLKARKELEEVGAHLPHFHLHMMFLGSPGVGKTTIARIIAKVLFDMGYIREEKLIEVTSKDLVGNGNQTGIKTNRAILSALGGVLFVDEAYSLSNSCGQAGAESIATLIKAMEDYKGDLVVMFAGYTLEMNDFVKSNSGIASRIAYTFSFENYSIEELYDIFKLKVRLSGMEIAPEAEKAIIKIIEWGSGRKNFGNGRYIDKLFQRTLTKHATLDLSKKEILTIKKESVPTVEEIMQTFGRFMG